MPLKKKKAASISTSTAIELTDTSIKVKNMKTLPVLKNL